VRSLATCISAPGGSGGCGSGTKGLAWKSFLIKSTVNKSQVKEFRGGRGKHMIGERQSGLQYLWYEQMGMRVEDDKERRKVAVKKK